MRILTTAAEAAVRPGVTVRVILQERDFVDLMRAEKAPDIQPTVCRDQVSLPQRKKPHKGCWTVPFKMV